MSEKVRPYFTYRDYPVFIETLITQEQAVYQKDMRLFFCHKLEKEILIMKTEKTAVTTNNKTNGGNNMKGFFGGMKKKLVPALCGMGMMMSQMTTTCFAAGTGTSAVTQPLDNLKTLVIAVIGAVGVIILAKNVMEFAQAYQQQDSSTMNSALKGIVAGVMMAGISTVLTFLGF
jgi:energy-converting hydrogenase Eha subunit C